MAGRYLGDGAGIKCAIWTKTGSHLGGEGRVVGGARILRNTSHSVVECGCSADKAGDF